MLIVLLTSTHYQTGCSIEGILQPIWRLASWRNIEALRLNDTNHSPLTTEESTAQEEVYEPPPSAGAEEDLYEDIYQGTPTVSEELSQWVSLSLCSPV